MGILDFIFPKKCFGCGVVGEYLCEKCLDELFPARVFCPVCKKASVDGMVHIHCNTPYSLDGVRCIWTYDGALRKSLISLKYKFTYDVAQCIVETIDKRALFPLPKEAIFVPIPLYKSRQNWRGFNQSEILGKLVTAKFGWKFEPNLLLRNKKTHQQTGLARQEREKNIRGAFSLNPNFDLNTKSYVLFDDVWTTGSTMKEACKVLKRNGAKKVWGLTIGGPA